ncbi:hypothetical protein O1611_g2705 [Lasiodiplodia mahajangana]|uniref:Uncharacterized protein n=1 Tax=Lasiodiplodia mahajangana TaxID=1108764 RepID=A0ACC2JTS9_9PEZI|nr:hypothetical protein O1611_g2705 [Lasiodiplodia mahajangana]
MLTLDESAVLVDHLRITQCNDEGPDHMSILVNTEKPSHAMERSYSETRIPLPPPGKAPDTMARHASPDPPEPSSSFSTQSESSMSSSSAVSMKSTPKSPSSFSDASIYSIQQFPPEIPLQTPQDQSYGADFFAFKSMPVTSTVEPTTVSDPTRPPTDASVSEPSDYPVLSDSAPTAPLTDLLNDGTDDCHMCITNEPELMLSYEEAVVPTLSFGNTSTITSNVDNGDMESDDTDSISDTESIIGEYDPVKEVVTIVGPEYGHLAQRLATILTSGCLTPPLCDFQQLTSRVDYTQRSVQGSPGGNSHSSGTSGGISSSGIPSDASSSNTSPSSSPSGQKRKSSGKGSSDDPGDGEENDGGKNEGRPSKRAKRDKPRYDCPIYRATHMGASSKTRVCTPDGLEFRHVWDHLRKVHLGCETCGKKLDTHKALTTHLFERENDSSKCQQSSVAPPRHDISIGLWLEMIDVYEKKDLNHVEKWIKWWKLLYPNTDDADIPDPRHHDAISLSTADIPKVQVMLHEMWDSNPLLPPLTDEQKQILSVLLSKLLQLSTVAPSRRQPRKPRRVQQQQTPPAAEAEPATAQVNNQNTWEPQLQQQHTPTLIDAGQTMTQAIIQNTYDYNYYPQPNQYNAYYGNPNPQFSFPWSDPNLNPNFGYTLSGG